MIVTSLIITIGLTLSNGADAMPSADSVFARLESKWRPPVQGDVRVEKDVHEIAMPPTAPAAFKGIEPGKSTNPIPGITVVDNNQVSSDDSTTYPPNPEWKDSTLNLTKSITNGMVHLKKGLHDALARAQGFWRTLPGYLQPPFLDVTILLFILFALLFVIRKLTNYMKLVRRVTRSASNRRHDIQMNRL